MGVAVIIAIIAFNVFNEADKAFNIYSKQPIFEIESRFTKPITSPLTGPLYTTLTYEVFKNTKPFDNAKVKFELIGDNGAMFDNDRRIFVTTTDAQGQAFVKIKAVKEGNDILKATVIIEAVFDEFEFPDDRKYSFSTS